jgi:hypothetical protein
LFELFTSGTIFTIRPIEIDFTLYSFAVFLFVSVSAVRVRQKDHPPFSGIKVVLKSKNENVGRPYHELITQLLIISFLPP